MIGRLRAALARVHARTLGRALAAVARGVREVLDSPLVELDVRELLSSWRTGVVLGILTLAVGLVALAAGAASSDSPFRAIVARFGMGHYLVVAAQLAIAAALTLLVPIRAIGLVEGTRWRGFFDQLVTSGLPPRTYYLGRALSAQGLIALVFVGTAPLVLALALVDPPPVEATLADHALLLVYAELLLAATLGLGALFHESIAAITTIGLAVGLGVAATLPVPTALVALSPVRTIAGAFCALGNERLTPVEREVLYGPPRLLGVDLPLVPYAIGLSLLVGALAASACFVGRPHSLAPGLDSFGAVVLKGDRRRAAILRFRPTLVRRSELAFFFENHGPRHAALAPWARLARASGLVVLLTLLPLAALWDDSLLALFLPREQVLFGLGVVGGVFGALAGLAPLVFASSRHDAPVDLALGRLRVPMVLADVFAYALLATGLVLFYERLTEALATSGALSFTPFWGISFKTRADMVAGFEEWARLLAVTGGALLLVQKVFGLRLNDAALGTILALGIVGATDFLPAMVDVSSMRAHETHARSRAGSDDDPERSPEQNAASLAALHLCPFFRMELVTHADELEDVPLPPGRAWPWFAREGFWVIYPTLVVLLFLATVQLVRLRRHEARTALAEALGPEPAAVRP